MGRWVQSKALRNAQTDRMCLERHARTRTTGAGRAWGPGTGARAREETGFLHHSLVF